MHKNLLLWIYPTKVIMIIGKDNYEKIYFKSFMTARYRNNLNIQ